MATRSDGDGLQPPVVLVHAGHDLFAQQVRMFAAQHQRRHIRHYVEQRPELRHLAGLDVGDDLAAALGETPGPRIGQLLALSLILIVMGFWRRRESFWRHAYAANVVMMAAGFVLIGYQLTGYFIS